MKIFILTSFYITACLSSNCEKGYFILQGMSECHELLTCADMSKLVFKTDISSGSTKHVSLFTWQNHLVTVSVLANKDFEADFLSGLDNLIDLNPSPFVTQLIGFCRENFVIITEFHNSGSAKNVMRYMQKMQKIQPLICLNFCINYVEILQMLHSEAGGNRVMCDSNSLSKTLEQLLLTSDGRLLLNDVDASPKLNGGLIKCGHRQLYGNFVAPEQLWPKENGEFDDDLMPGYDEKTDIWKLSHICQYFLKFCDNGKVLALHLHDIHKKCLDLDPKLRPTANDVFKQYVDVKNKVNELLKDEL